MSARCERSPWRASVQGGVDGWTLEEMDWDADTGIATFWYRNADGRTSMVLRAQPTMEGHVQWAIMCSVPHSYLPLERVEDTRAVEFRAALDAEP